MLKTNQVSRPQLERAARMYHRSGDAARALGIARGTFTRLCREHGIETPHQRRQREKGEARRK